MMALSAVSVKVSEPVRVPAVVGTKLMVRVQVAAEARVASEEPAPRNGHADPDVLLSEKFVVTTGVVPEMGGGKVRGALPLFVSTTTCEGLVEPTLVAAKVRGGPSARSILKAEPLKNPALNRDA